MTTHFSRAITLAKCTVAHKSHDAPCFHKKYMEAGVMTFAAYCTIRSIESKIFSALVTR